MLQARRRARARRDGVRLLGAAIRSATAWPSSTQAARWSGSRKSPRKPRSNYAVTGLYFYDGRASDFAAALKPSPRGELEITDLNRCYLDEGVAAPGAARPRLSPGWTPARTSRCCEASNYIETIEERQGLRVCCPEEIAFEQRLDRCRAAGDAGRAAGEERLRPVPARPRRARASSSEGHRNRSAGLRGDRAAGVRRRARLSSSKP